MKDFSKPNSFELWYVDWVSNIVPFIKKNGSLRLCIYFRDLNVVTPKNKYIMSNRLNIW